MKKKLFILFILFSLSVVPSFSKKAITYDQAFKRGNDGILNTLPTIRGWLDDRFYLEMKDKLFYKVDARTGKSYPMQDSGHADLMMKYKLTPTNQEDASGDYSKILFLKDGLVYCMDVKAKKIIEFKISGEHIENPVFSPDGNYIAYTREGNLYYYDMGKALEYRLTDDGSSDILNGYASWVYYEEILGRGGKYRAFWWSPDSKRIAFLRFDQTKVPVFPIFNAEKTYGELEQQRYPKPGYPNPTVKIGIAALGDRSIEWLDHKDPSADEYYLSFPMFSKNSATLYFQWLNRGQNHLKILRYDLTAKTLETAYDEQQSTWVEFPGFEDLFVLSDGKLVIRSSRSGWDHLYIVDKKGALRALTSGSWSVSRLHVVNEKLNQIYFSARKEDSTELDCYSIDLSGKKMKRLTRDKGFHMVLMSKNGSFFLDRYSNVTTPFRYSLYNNRGRLMRKLGDMYKKELDDYALATVELFRIKITEDFELPAVWYLPHDFDKSNKYPVVINVYGGPGSTSVYNVFPFRSPFSNHFLANQGIIVLSVDHRGSGHFGKKGMDLMYRQLGKLEMEDFIAVVKYLRELPFVNSDKIGITGGSYGGYVTALALTKHPEYFKYGIADFSVVDWKLYDSVYTERYMDLPLKEEDIKNQTAVVISEKDMKECNFKGYEESSVLNYIDKYQGGLRITHGTMDDNVHCQNTIQYIDRILNAGKTVELMLYPGERHGFRSKKRDQYNKASVNFWLKNFFGKTLE